MVKLEQIIQGYMMWYALPGTDRLSFPYLTAHDTI
jgi:hypothetical protein